MSTYVDQLVSCLLGTHKYDIGSDVCGGYFSNRLVHIWADWYTLYAATDILKALKSVFVKWWPALRSVPQSPKLKLEKTHPHMPHVGDLMKALSCFQCTYTL